MTPTPREILKEKLYEKFKGYYEEQIGYSTIELEMLPFIETFLEEARQDERNKIRKDIDMLTIYCRSIFSQDCSRGEGEKEKNTQMLEYESVKQIIQSL